MSDIITFVDSIAECYERLFPNIEEDQQLPSRRVLLDVCRVLLNVSCMREEGRFPTFRVCFVRPDSEYLEAYIYAHPMLFKKPIEFNSREMHKLAPALNADMSYLMLDIRRRPFKAIGILAAYTTWEKIVTREVTSGSRMPRVPNLLVSGPGELKACFGESTFVSYCAGRSVFFRTDTFTDTLVAEQLKKDATVSERDRLDLLYRILWLMSKYSHGGAVLIVPSASSCSKFVDVKYPMPAHFLFGDEKGGESLSPHVRDKEIITYADMIAKLTSVDGSVLLTKHLDLIGFGVETLTDKMESRIPAMSFIEYDNTENKFKKFKDNGMRHRAAYRFCNVVEGSVAFVISQDGSIEACTKHGGKVVVYDNIALPMM